MSVDRVTVPVLLYHQVSSLPAPSSAPYAVTPATFAHHMDLLVAGGHTAMTVPELSAVLSGHRPMPPAAVLVTFDDGYADTLEVAGPVLRDRALRATAYLTTGHLRGCPERPAGPAPGPMLDWGQLGELEASGFEVGAHSHTHPQLDVLPPARVDDEVRRSRDLLEGALGHPVTTFAYPHGWASRSVQDVVRRAGFGSACGVRNALSHESDNPFLIARLMVGASTPSNRVSAWLEGRCAPVAPRREQARTTAWRGVRRARHLLGPGVRP